MILVWPDSRRPVVVIAEHMVVAEPKFLFHPDT